MVIDVIIPQPGANHIEIANETYERIEQLKKICLRMYPLKWYMIIPNLSGRLSEKCRKPFISHLSWL